MPTANPRIQVCCEPGLYAQAKTLAKGRNQTLSSVAQYLMEEALKLPHVREQLEEAAAKYGAVPVKPDGRTKARQRPHYKANPEDLLAAGNEAIASGYSEEERAKAMNVLGIKAKTDAQAQQEKWEAEKELGMDIPPEMKEMLMKKLLEKLMA